MIGIFWNDGRGLRINEVPDRDEPFRFLDGLVVRPLGEAPHLLGPLYYRSFLAYSGGRFADQWLPRSWLTALSPPRPPSPAPEAHDESMQQFLTRVVDEVRRDGGEPLIAFLPVPFEHSYDPQVAELPPAVRWIDLHRELADSGHRVTTIADHYSADTTRATGRILGRAIESALKARDQASR